MAVAQKPQIDPLFSRKATTREEMAELMREIDARAGIVGEPTMTIEELHELQKAHGVRPEDNGATRELLRMRYGDDYTQDEE